ncbi:hypothetical protein FQN54_009343 [Arachnomyces sp. PD_36]|nr:hypothetical protein FQN54_009343 [Arachnomyces sp. PD_36]
MFSPAYRIENFKPWIPPRIKSLNSSNPNPNISPSLKSHKPSDSEKFSSHPLPAPRSQVLGHPLPARPPAEVCVHTTADTRSDITSTSTSRSQPQESSEQPPGTPCTENVTHGMTSPHDPVDNTPNSDPNPSCGFQDVPSFRDDIARDNSSSPSTTGSDDSWEEFFKLQGVQSNIPIDPLILSEDLARDANDLHGVLPQDDGASVSETFCSYPEPPSVLQKAPEHHQVSSEQPDSQNDIPQANSSLQIQGHQQLLTRPSVEPNTSGKAPKKKPQSGEQSQTCKRKAQRSEEQTRKRRRTSTSLVKKHSLAVFCSHFTSLPLEERLQFLSWLFEGALPRCMPDSVPTTCEDGDMHSAIHSTVHDIKRTRRNCRKAYNGSRKGKLWSNEEEDLLLKLRKEEGRPWSEVTRLFSDQYPGRSSGSIQVYWSTTLKNRE